MPRLRSRHCVFGEVLGTIDYVAPDGTIIFRTCSAEKDKVVFQMGTCDAKRALKVAKIIEDDVAGIDVNMGCPKEFSIKGGMGAALLEQPEKVREILTTLVNGIKKPVTCKIRILPNLEETLNLVKIIESTGVKALAVHGRIRTQRSSQPCNYDVISEISKSISIPVIANGGSLDVKSFDEIERFRKNTCCSSVMLARAAEWNPSVFRRQGLLSTQNEIKDYLTYALMFDHNFPGTKYCICQLMHKSLDTDDGQKLLASKTFDELCEIFGMKSQLNQVVEKRRRKLGEIEEEIEKSIGYAEKRRKTDGFICKNIKFNKHDFPKTITPKMILFEHTRKSNLPPPKYTTETNSDRLFKSVLTVDGRKYGTLTWEKSKQATEQAAAMVYLKHHGLSDGKKIK
ncbi:tRNA-dihydrouridine(20) synthase [NAD(P)+]-like isoform X2 [Rhopilema esculentum]|uniref:tRNA-dihydrouridine(20) synthase [NAD(P)+]-like isoform X2 n=1 Tax=Rhopilema esculentum TaxID=499914 RepID=UPI0031DDFC4E